MDMRMTAEELRTEIIERYEHDITVDPKFDDLIDQLIAAVKR